MPRSPLCCFWLPPDIRDDLMQLCAADNRRLGEAFDLDLARYGYWTESR